MSFKLKYAPVTLAVFILFTACTKKPEQPVSPTIKISIETRETQKYCIIDFSCALKNENDSTAFVNVSGSIGIKDNNGTSVINIPFTIKAILPFDSGVVMQRIEMKESEAAAIMQFLDMSTEKIESGEDSGARPLEDKNIEISSLKYEKKDIIDLLKGK